MTDHTVEKNPISIPHTVWYADDIRRGEREAANALGLTFYKPMLRAGEAAFQVCRSAYPGTRHWPVLCGHGSNGGDGYMVARLARAIGIDVTLLARENDKPLPEEAVLVRKAQLNAGGEIHASNVVWPESVDLIVDALLGIGLQQAPRESISQSIDRTNTHPVPTVAADIPSSLLVETGATPGAVINVDHTTASIALKSGLLTGKARDATGQLHFDSLGPDNWLAGQETKIQQSSAERPSRWLISRRPTSHKNDHGWLVIIGGNHDTVGAICMTGEVMLRAGTGLVRVLTRSENIAPLLIVRPELMVYELTMGFLIEGLGRADVVITGPDLGQ